MEAIWTLGSPPSGQFSPLSGQTRSDVVIIGAGITGLTTALSLAESGMHVTVLEAHTVGAGCTGGSTGNLYSTLAKGLAPVRKKWSDEVLRDVVASRSQAIDSIEATVSRFGIDCGFHRRPLYRLVAQGKESMRDALEEERQAMLAAGLTVQEAESNALPVPIITGVKLENQAQFNPLAYVRGLARELVHLGVTIHEHSAVRDVDYKRGVVETEAGAVEAEHIVHATHTPKGINLLQSVMLPSREYGVSARLKPDSAYPQGTFWVLDDFHSLRSYHHDGDDYLMVIGEKHKVGEGEVDDVYPRRLRDYLSDNFDVQDFTHAWSAQQYSPADELPYIGRWHGRDKVYLATGFAADGLVWGALAGAILGDLILGRDNRWHERFDARRFTPVKSAKQWAKENVSVATHFVPGYLSVSKLESLDDVAPGQGKVATLEGEKVAIYRDDDGKVSVLSAVCPHMKCLVHWNDIESTWDCSCHGSRFDTQGEVIEGPSYHPLARRTKDS
ncbi:FAD-dependent oxidoreductase [Modicisalibacter luteus]|uniref:FAD-dependent oxidoreductase n=1 Tax=Modicisalibacter luteus TaxID=453962 RepID=A0ABV7M0I0_9GAMM|nr:FAD-dependent oxidoreductase [Halomonas lutea]GHA95290.1 FAD-dependent oxidoreductase [Halomonas lutea]